MAQTVYIETTIVSYVAACRARTRLTQVRQEAARAWWENRRGVFELVISQLVLDEAADGDPDAVERRFNLLAGLPLLDVTPSAIELAGRIQRLARIARSSQDPPVRCARRRPSTYIPALDPFALERATNPGKAYAHRADG